MTEFQSAWNKASSALKSDGDGSEGQPDFKEPGTEQESEDATMKVAGKVANAGGRELSHQERAKLGPVVHYSFGTLQGAVYGSVLEMTRVRGGILPALAFGTALFALADEVALPALGLTGKASESPLSSHVYGLVSHLVYGLSTDLARRG